MPSSDNIAALSARLSSLEASLLNMQTEFATFRVDIYGQLSGMNANLNSMTGKLSTLESFVYSVSSTGASTATTVTTARAELQALRQAVQQAISTIGIIIEEMRSGNSGAVPAEMAELFSALSRI